MTSSRGPRIALVPSAASLLIIIPAWNEQETIADVIAEVRREIPLADVLVVNDGSKDRTVQIARASGATVLDLPINLGVGGAMRAGYKYALRTGYDRTVQLDADGQHAPAAVAALVFAPWAVRDWIVFGSPLPGQTLANALSVNPTDIFAYRDQPTVAHYLAQGPAALIGMRVTGIIHNLVDVLIVPGFPIGFVGLLALPNCARLHALRPLVLVAVITFLVTGLVFPVSTTWGTFLHSAGAIYVLLIVSCLVALDAFIAWVGRLRHWWRPVAWLGPALATAVVVPLMFVSVISLDRQADGTRARYEALPAALDRAGVPLASGAPIITDNPIWLAETAHVTALALPEESPQAVLALARHFGSKLLIVLQTDGEREWPGILTSGEPATQCFHEVPLTDESGRPPAAGSPLSQIRAFQIVCS